jgi:hypothetical protein
MPLKARRLGGEDSETALRRVKTDKSKRRPHSRPRAAPIAPRIHGILDCWDRGGRSTRNSSRTSSCRDRWLGRNYRFMSSSLVSRAPGADQGLDVDPSTVDMINQLQFLWEYCPDAPQRISLMPSRRGTTGFGGRAKAETSPAVAGETRAIPWRVRRSSFSGLGCTR